MTNIKAIEELSNAFGPSGFEEDVVKVIRKYQEEMNVRVDSMNNVYSSLKGNTGNRVTVMLDAHSDEVGFMVQSVMSNGLIRFQPLGGWITTNIPAHEVVIRNGRGEYIKGITTSRPPHFMSEADRERKLMLEDIFIDVGATSRAEVIEDFGIEAGDPVAPSVNFRYNEKNGVVMGKAFDNRMGCLCIIETLERLKEEVLNIDVIGAFAAQEEVGTRGAEVTARTVQPDLAIVFEGSPADDLYYDEFTAQGSLKKEHRSGISTSPWSAIPISSAMPRNWRKKRAFLSRPLFGLRAGQMPERFTFPTAESRRWFWESRHGLCIPITAIAQKRTSKRQWIWP